MGLGANQPEDAIYPLLEADADGASLGGSSDYLCHFAAGELPPADAFWSIGITMRLHAPRPEALDGRWNPPPVRRIR